MTLVAAASAYDIALWPKFQLILECIDLGITKLLIRSCNSAGKSTILSLIAVHRMKEFEDIQVIMTGASASQLNQTLWRATKRVARRAGMDVSRFTDKGWEPSEHRRAVPIAPSKVESAQGFHAKQVDVFIDEATSMDSDKLTALFSNASGSKSLKILTYNPINPDAAVVDLENIAVPIESLLDQDGALDLDLGRAHAQTTSWLSIGISAFEHPNVIQGFEVIKGAVTRSSIEDMLRTDSIKCDAFYPDAIILPWNNTAWMPTPKALARICGQWSELVTVGFISGSVVVNAWKTEPSSGLRIGGADIGAGDDPSVWCHFRGNEQTDFESLTTGDTGVTAMALDKYCVENELDAIGIDDTGVGRGVTDRLQELKDRKYKVIPINFSSSPQGFREVAIRKPANARCEMFLLLEKQMRGQQIRILYDKELQRELCCMKIQSSKQSDTLRIEDKALIKRRLGRSPNKADSTALARYAARLLKQSQEPLLY